MKKSYFVLCIILFIPIAIYAEDFKSGSFFGLQIESSGFCEASLKIQKILNSPNPAFDIKGAWIINHRFYLGLSLSLALRDMTDFNVIDWSLPQNITFGYMGPQIGVLLNPSDLIVCEISMMVGYGAVGYSYDYHMTGDGFMVYEPAAGINIGLFDFLKISLSASYFICDRIDMSKARSEDFNGFCFRLGAKLGKF